MCPLLGIKTILVFTVLYKIFDLKKIVRHMKTQGKNTMSRGKKSKKNRFI